MVIEEYPDSEYAKSATLKLTASTIWRRRIWRSGAVTSSVVISLPINRFRAVVQDSKTTTHTAEALERLVEAYLALGLTERHRLQAILGFNYQSSPFIRCVQPAENRVCRLKPRAPAGCRRSTAR